MFFGPGQESFHQLSQIKATSTQQGIDTIVISAMIFNQIFTFWQF